MGEEGLGRVTGKKDVGKGRVEQSLLTQVGGDEMKALNTPSFSCFGAFVMFSYLFTPIPQGPDSMSSVFCRFPRHPYPQSGQN